MTTRENRPQGLDFEKAEAAFKRAAEKAVHGTREKRSGRFMPAKKPGNGPSRRAARQSKDVVRNR
jgi:hypothetical protein